MCYLCIVMSPEDSPPQTTACTIVATVRDSPFPIKYASFVSANYCIYPSRLSPFFSPFSPSSVFNHQRRRPILSFRLRSASFPAAPERSVAGGQLLSLLQKKREKVFCIFYLISYFEPRLGDSLGKRDISRRGKSYYRIVMIRGSISESADSADDNL